MPSQPRHNKQHRTLSQWADPKGMPHRRHAEIADLRGPIVILTGFDAPKVRLDEFDGVAEGARAGDVADNIQRAVGREVPLLPETKQLLAVPCLHLQADKQSSHMTTTRRGDGSYGFMVQLTKMQRA